MKKVRATGRTVEEAVRSALVKLGATRSQATVQVLQEPVKGLFGLLGAREAEVEVCVAATPEETARDFLVELLRHMGLDASVRVGARLDGDGISLEILCESEDLPVVIGRHGSTLDAMQYLTNVVVNQDRDVYIRVYVDAGDYRRRRQEGLLRMADRAALRAVRTKRPVAMDPMPSHDRKVVHTYLQERTDVTTTSEGTDPHRKVVVVPVVQSGPPRD
ncbi:MAG: protein jag [Alicyclobacillus sp.]|nr:protein jag [Alicyclobacillus sp.]